MNKFYQCEFCAKKFPVFANFWEKTPEKKFIKPNRKISFRNFDIVDCGKICHSCDKKLLKKIEKIVKKDRNDDKLILLKEERELRKLAHDQAFDNPFGTDKETVEKAEKIYDNMIAKKYGKYECNLCHKRYDKFRENLCNRDYIMFAQSEVFSITMFCYSCKRKIAKEIKDLIDKK